MLLLLCCLVILPSTRAFIDCGMACRQCREELRDYPMREVYCAMCRECRERRRERRAMQQELRQREDKEYGWDPQEQQEPPPGCPTPPDCDTSVEILNSDVTTTQPTTCMPVTTARTCPPIIPCRDRKKMTERLLPSTTPSTTPLPPVTPMYMPCVSCMPMCPCPAIQQAAASPMTAPPTSPSTTPQDFFYLYIGFPKGALNKTDD